MLSLLSLFASSAHSTSNSGSVSRSGRVQLFLLGCVAGCVVWGSGAWGLRAAIAATPDTAPPEVKTLLSRLDEAANRRDLNAVMQFYSTNLTHSDGLTYQTLEQSLSQLWKQYPTLSYRTELQSWQLDKGVLTLETVTYITGTQQRQGQAFTLKSTLRSRQTIENQRILRQEILAEQSQLTSGKKPPEVEMILPETVTPGQQFAFDAIVKEPLGDSLMLGAVLEEPVKPGSYISPQPIDLEPLSAGGLFKTGRAPATQGSRWISAVLIRGDGVTRITQRLRVVEKK